MTVSGEPRKEADEPASSASFGLMRNPGFQLRRLASQSHALFHKLSEQDDVTAPQLTVLAALIEKGPLTQAALSRLVGIDKNTLSEMLKRMVGRGLVRRSKPQGGGRSAMLAATPSGEACAAALVASARAVGEAILAPLPAGHRSVFIECLDILAAADLLKT